MKIEYQNYWKKISIDDLKSFLNIDSKTKTLKRDLIESCKVKMSTNQIFKKKFFKIFEKETGLSAYNVEKILNCTKTQRKNWELQGKLKVVDYIQFEKYGKILETPVYARYPIEFELVTEDIDRWIQEDKIRKDKNKQKNKEKIIKKTLATKQVREHLRKTIIQDFKSDSAKWLNVSPFLDATFELAYWTVYISRLAKTMQEKSFRKTKNSNKYREEKTYLYKLKDDSLELLSKSPFCKISFYRPEDADKYDIYLCEEHFECYRDIRDLSGYYNVFDYYLDNKKEINRCKDCDVTFEKDYYSLYFFEIKSKDFKDISFSFHLPYDLGKSYLPSPSQLPDVKHIENTDGIFRFGRSLSDDEEYVFTPSFIKNNFKASFNKFNNVFMHYNSDNNNNIYDIIETKGSVF